MAVVGFVLVALASETLGSVLGWGLVVIGFIGLIIEARKRSANLKNK